MLYLVFILSALSSPSPSFPSCYSLFFCHTVLPAVMSHPSQDSLQFSPLFPKDTLLPSRHIFIFTLMAVFECLCVSVYLSLCCFMYFSLGLLLLLLLLKNPLNIHCDFHRDSNSLHTTSRIPLSLHPCNIFICFLSLLPPIFLPSSLLSVCLSVSLRMCVCVYAQMQYRFVYVYVQDHRATSDKAFFECHPPVLSQVSLSLFLSLVWKLLCYDYNDMTLCLSVFKCWFRSTCLHASILLTEPSYKPAICCFDDNHYDLR